MKRSRLSNDRGVVMVLLAVVLLVLLGVAALAVDLGRLYAAKQRAQNVADASALAGCMFLTGSPEGEPASQAAADHCAESNNSTNTGTHWKAYNPDTNDAGVLVTFPYGEITTDAGEVLSLEEGEAIQIDAKVPLEFGFANVLGWANAEAPARAIAALDELTTITAMLVPWSVTTSELWDSSGNPILGPNQPETLKVVSWQDQPIGPGNFGAVTFEDDAGGNIYRRRIAGDPSLPPVTLSEDMWIDTQPGNKIGPTDQGVLDRLEGDNWTYEGWKATYDESTGTFAETSRLILIPIIDVSDGLNGQKQVKVTGFAAFFIESYDTKSGEVTGTFMRALTIGETINWNPFGTFKPGTDNLVDTIKLVG